MQQLIIPWRDPDCVFRSRHFNNLYNFYSQYFEILVADNIGNFNRSSARNSGVERSSSEIIAVIDADNFVEPKYLYEAIEIARDGYLVKPFQWFGYLTENSTEKFYAGVRNTSDLEFESPPRRGFFGGSYVMKKSLWIEVGGMDEGFVGWGAEDDAFHIKCNRASIKTQYTSGFCYHLYHPAYRVTDKRNARKMKEEYYRV